MTMNILLFIVAPFLVFAAIGLYLGYMAKAKRARSDENADVDSAENEKCQQAKKSGNGEAVIKRFLKLTGIMASDNDLERIQRNRSKNNTKEILISISDLDSCKAILNELLNCNNVIITMQDLDDSLVQRAVDLLGGAVYVLRGTMCKIASRAYLVCPNNIDVVNTTIMPDGIKVEEDTGKILPFSSIDK